MPRNRSTNNHAAADAWKVRVDPPDLPEWMDEPCSYEDFRACVRDIGSVNRWTFGHRPTLGFVRGLLSRAGSPGRPMKLVDVGSGGGDTLREIVRWADRKQVAITTIGIDLNPHATRAAQELSAGRSRDTPISQISWYTGDALTHPQTQDCDAVISSLVTHHMRDAEIVDFLRWMEAHAGRGWFINDLLRSPRASRLFRLLATVMRWHRFVRHDGPVSFRRAFRTEDWMRLLAEAGVPLEAVRFTQPVPGRLCLTRLR